jgi:hypothetical protein
MISRHLSEYARPICHILTDTALVAYSSLNPLSRSLKCCRCWKPTRVLVTSSARLWWPTPDQTPVDEADAVSETAFRRSGHAHLSALVESPSSSYRLDECDILDASVALTDRTNEFSFAQQVDATAISKPVEVPCFGVSLRRRLAN